MVDDVEHDDIERLKAWWREYGAAVVTGILAGLLIFGGYRYWLRHVETRAAQASAIYEQMQVEHQERKFDLARSHALLLLNDFKSTPYAGLGALLLAQMDFQAGELKGAQEYLRWVMRHGKDEAQTHVARLRLARILLQLGKLEDVLTVLPEQNTETYKSEYEETRGDALHAMGRHEEAAAAYKKALDHAYANPDYQQIVFMKLNAVQSPRAGIPKQSDATDASSMPPQ